MTEPDAASREAPLPRPGVVREITDRAIVESIITAGPATRSTLAKRTGISKPTVAVAVQRLETSGLVSVIDEGGGPSRTRPVFGIASSAGHVGAMDLQPDKTSIRFVDLAGRKLLGREAARSRGSVEEVLAMIRAAAADVAPVHPASGRLQALALAVPNPVDKSAHQAVPLPEVDPELLTLIDALADEFDTSVFVDNDVNLAGLAEREFGAAADLDDFLYVYVGVGLGTALVLNGDLVRGSRGIAGELGFMTVRQPGSSQSRRHALVQAMVAAGFGAGQGDRIDVALALEVCARAAAGSAPDLGVINEVGQLMGEAIASICAIIDPHSVVLGGPIGGQPILRERVRAVVSELAPVPVPVVPGVLGAEGPLEGALALATRHVRSGLLTAT